MTRREAMQLANRRLIARGVGQWRPSSLESTQDARECPSRGPSFVESARFQPVVQTRVREVGA